MGIKEFILGKKCFKCGSRTRSTFRSKPTCYLCKMDIKIEEERIRICPHSRHRMKKKVIYKNIIIDKCPVCGGVWLDSGELDKIKKYAEADGSDFAIGLAAGMGSGMAMGTIMSRR